MELVNPLILSILAVLVSKVDSLWKTEPPFYGQQYAQVGGVRGLLVDPSGDLLALSRTSGGIAVLFEQSNEDGTIDVVQELVVVASGLGLNHGLAYNQGFLYASSPTAVYRWPYIPGNRTQVIIPPEMVVQDIPPGGHSTRTITFNPQGILYVSVGSLANVDVDSERARIRRFNLMQGNLPLNFTDGEIFADGLRNEVGLGWDLNGVLYGVENGGDQLNRPDLGGDIHNGNPAEELNRFDQPPSTHYGYPYCFSTYNLTGYQAGTQFAWPSFMNDGVHTDSWCRQNSNNHPPALSMPAHMAPLGIEFYRGQSCPDGEGAFPCSAVGDAFVAFHGSWNSVIPVGYRVGWFPFDKNTGEPTGQEIRVIFEENTNFCLICFRPVNAVFNHKGHLFVSADVSGIIVKVTYDTPPRQIRAFRAV